MNANLALCHRVVTHPKPETIQNQNYSKPKTPKLKANSNPKTPNYTQISKPKTQMFWVSFGIGTYLFQVSHIF
jgi:hypothetical protein